MNRAGAGGLRRLRQQIMTLCCLQHFLRNAGNANLYHLGAGLWTRPIRITLFAGIHVKYVLIFLLVLVIFIISFTFGAHNDQVVTFNYLLAQGQYRVSTLLTVLFAIGFILGWVICGLFYLRVRLALLRAERKIKRLEQRPDPAGGADIATTVPAAGKE